MDLLRPRAVRHAAVASAGDPAVDQACDNGWDRAIPDADRSHVQRGYRSGAGRDVDADGARGLPAGRDGGPDDR